MLLLVGYLWGMIKREPKLISVDLVNFRRKEQKQWLIQYFGKAFRISRAAL
jgi:hypothetical protein